MTAVTITTYRDPQPDFWLDALLEGGWIAEVHGPWDHPAAQYGAREPGRTNAAEPVYVLSRRGLTRRHAEWRARRAFARARRLATLEEDTKRTTVLEGEG